MYSALADACTYSIGEDGRKSKEGMTEIPKKRHEAAAFKSREVK